MSIKATTWRTPTNSFMIKTEDQLQKQFKSSMFVHQTIHEKRKHNKFSEQNISVDIQNIIFLSKSKIIICQIQFSAVHIFDCYYFHEFGTVNIHYNDTPMHY